MLNLELSSKQRLFEAGLKKHPPPQENPTENKKAPNNATSGLGRGGGKSIHFGEKNKTKHNLSSHPHLSTTSHPTHTYSHIFCLGKKPQIS